MLASEIMTEEWLVEVLDDSMQMDWTAVDGARAIIRALRAGLIRLPQTGGQIAHVASAGDRVQAVEILAQAFERSGDDLSAKMVREAEANSKLRKGYCTPIHMEVALDALVNMRALEATFGYRPPSGDQGPVSVGQATQPTQVGDTDAREVGERPPVHREAEGVCLNHPVQAAWDSVSTLPAIAFSEQEAGALAAALARPHSAVAPARDGVEVGKVLDDIVPLSIASTWDEAERRNIIRAMQEYAALARPRAAVGDWSFDMAAAPKGVDLLVYRHDGDKMPWVNGVRAIASTEWGGWYDAEGEPITAPVAWAALQSPPAKLEP
ncbi:hypothetical protein [Sphingomonas sp. Leaf4]|uniref:hypothetical protein n=1 Tax=Sphingomonas sp. Leaf4 TaxID=2876553 RepID=UPI001E424183|nr:hypothetical protein [Sphingomonas sp. Leaf4]